MFKLSYPWKYRWKHENLAVIFLSTALAVMVLTSDEVSVVLTHAGSWGYLGALIAGFFFSSAFTVSLSIVTLFLLSESLDPLAVGLIGGAGAMFADFILVGFVKRSVSNLSEEIFELKSFITRHNPLHTDNSLIHRAKKYAVFALAGFILASPLPDELAIAMLGTYNLRTRNFLAISFVFNSLGIAAIALAAKVI